MRRKRDGEENGMAREYSSTVLNILVRTEDVSLTLSAA